MKGVAFSTQKMHSPKAILDWPGKKVADKVPTAICYSAGHKGIKSWGYLCPSPGEIERRMNVLKNFKLYLDKNFLERTDGSEDRIGTHEDVQMWFVDFLTALYKHVAQHICAELRLDSWELQIVHYIFTVPTTWETAVAELLETVARRAGFGKEERHSVEIKLTEAEAAAVYSASNPFHQCPVSYSGDDTESAPGASTQATGLREHDILLVCDSGGGTTVCFLCELLALSAGQHYPTGHLCSPSRFHQKF
jgi:hypothetical protein